jgi:GcrA cell cycle regulator
MADETLAKDNAMAWTEERVELLRKLWLEGLSASRIAAELSGGVTRNAVIGKVHRLGLSGRVKAAALAPAARARTTASKTSGPAPRSAPTRMMPMPTHGNNALAVQTRPVQAPQPMRGSGEIVPMAANVTIMDLRESMCRWPVGDPSSPEFRYCGGRAPIGEGPYCAYHSRMAYQPSQDRRQRRSA